ncbi:MAG: cell division protein SepF [Candidatus Nanoarchaeia archaeon]|nr:cell division protein SepF [Candidatus Nanoarchaeia archaeon]
MVFNKLKKVFSGGDSDNPEYIEIDLGKEPKKSRVLVRPFVLKTFEDINPILNSLREGYTIAVIDIKQLRSKDVIELKRAISKIKKTTDALEGSIAGFGENIIIVTPQFAEIYKAPAISQPQTGEHKEYKDY